MNQSEKHFDLLQELIDKAFKNFFRGESTSMELDRDNQCEVPPMGAVARAKAGECYDSIEEYKQQTGKRFRMTKDQKQRALSREEAFSETYGELNG